MNKYIAIILLTVSLLPFGTPAFADFQAGVDAYESGYYATALKEWKPLAEQGDAKAQVLLGFMYGFGQGVNQDYKGGFRWFKLAAEQGNSGAHSALGGMYVVGYGVMQDAIKAHMWLNIAALQGEEDAGNLRDEVAKDMTPADISKAQDLARECVAKDYKDC